MITTQSTAECVSFFSKKKLKKFEKKTMNFKKTVVKYFTVNLYKRGFGYGNDLSGKDKRRLQS